MAPAPGGGHFRRLQFADLHGDHFERSNEVRGDVGIPKAENRNATLGKPAFAPFISSFVVGFGMLPTVEFDHQTERRAIEVEHEGSGRMLSSEIDTELPVTQLLPQPHFDLGRIASQ